MNLFMLKKDLLVKIVIITILGQSTLAQTRMCESFFETEKFINPGVGIVENFDGSITSGLKLSNYDRIQGASPSQKKIAQTLNLMLTPISKYFKVEKLAGFANRLISDDRNISYKHKLVEALNLKLRFDPKIAEENIPAEGPLAIIGPHLSGGIDGMTMASLATLYRKRDDVLIVLTNRLAGIDKIPDNAVLIDDRDAPEAYENNKAPRRQITEHLKRGGAIVIFPSGNNATAYPLKSINPDNKLTKADYPYDAIWMAGLTTFIQAVPNTQILPMYTDRYFSDSYQYKKANSGGMASALTVPYEISQHIGSTVHIKIGQVMQGSEILHLAEQFAREQISSSTEDLTPAPIDLARAKNKTIYEIKVNNSFLGYLRSQVYQLLKVEQPSNEEMSPTEWIKRLNSK